MNTTISKGDVVSVNGTNAMVVRAARGVVELDNGLRVVPEFYGAGFSLVASRAQIGGAKKIARNAQKNGVAVDLFDGHNRDLRDVFGTHEGERTVAGITGRVVVVDRLCNFYPKAVS